MQRVAPSPLRLAKLTLVGAVNTLLAFAETLLPFPHAARGLGLGAMLRSQRLELVGVVVPLMFGVAMLYWNNHRLVSGINHLRFTEAELDEARQFVFSQWLTLTQVSVFLTLAVVAFLQIYLRRPGSSPVLILLAINPLNYLRTNLAKAPRAAAPIDWLVAKPIRSDHWGQTT